MFKKRAQGISINTIVIAIIALIVIVVIIAIFTGRVGVYSSGVNELTSCESTCQTLGYDDGRAASKSDCNSNLKGNTLPGTFVDVTGSAVAGESTTVSENIVGTGSISNPKCCCYNLNT